MDKREDADRNLLFGLLALQTGLIDQAYLVAAFQAWTRDKGRPLAEHLIALGHLDDSRRSVVEALVDLHVRQHGDTERSLASLNSGRSAGETLSLLAEVDPEAAPPWEDRGKGREGDRSDDFRRDAPPPPDGRRFRILRPHAHGNLGAVFVAIDEEVHREVALKQILDNQADNPSSRTRFVLEAEITGGLEHPGIVPVYGMGSYDNGRPYYAMRFIKGDSLKEAIAAFHADESLRRDPGKRSLALRRLLRRFVDICNAIDYAHTRGVIHRDIKPANVIVGKHGETLVVDWGLAKVTGRADTVSELGEQTLRPPSASGSAETMPGSAMGTPAYMSPEQAAGEIDQLGPRSDVYSLGATLFSLLTGRLPVERDHVVALLQAVQRGEIRTPRSLDPTIDPALEAVCLKAMALAPEARYATPKALADDIDRWSADEPVTAWREPFSRRLRRWGRRNRTAVAAASVAVLAALFGTAAVLAVQTKANADLKLVNTDLGIANAREAKANADLKSSNIALAAARDREAARFRLAAEAIKLFHGEVGDDLILKEDQFKPLRDKLLRTAAEFYGRLENLLEGQTDRASRLAMGDAYYELGTLIDTIGDKTASLTSYNKALTIFINLAAEPDVDPWSQGRVAQSHDKIGLALADTGKPAEALESHRKALGIRQKLADADPAVAPFQGDLAGSHNSIGNLLRDMSKPAEALESHRKALGIRQKLADADPAVAPFQGDLAGSHNSIGNLLWDMGKPAEALESHRKALGIRQKLADANPAVSLFQSDLAGSHSNIGLLLWETGKPAEALESHRKALGIRQKLADANPAVTLFQGRLADSYHNISLVLTDTGKPAEALESHRKALGILQKLADANPAVTLFQSKLAISHDGIGTLLVLLGKSTEAKEAYRKALEIQEVLAQDHPESPDFASYLGAMLSNSAMIDLAEKRFEEARSQLQRAIGWQKKALASYPASPTYRQHLKTHLINLIKADERLGLTPEVTEARRELEELTSDTPQARTLDGRLSSVLRGEAPLSNAERLVLAQHAYGRSLHAAAARLWGQAFAADGELTQDRQAQHRYYASRCAALAGSGMGKDEPKPDEAERKNLRQQALAWLEAEVGAWRIFLFMEPDTKIAKSIVVKTLQHWKKDPDLSGVRDPDGLAKLPESERAAWEGLWSDVDALLKRAEGKGP